MSESNYMTVRDWQKRIDSMSDQENFFEVLNDKMGGLLVDFKDLDEVSEVSDEVIEAPWSDLEHVESKKPFKRDEKLIDFLDHRIKHSDDFLELKDKADLQLVFVYGTLKKGQGNHGLLNNAIYLGAGHTRKTFNWLKRTGFPVVMERKTGTSAEETGRILGEVYAVDLNQMVALDRLESNGVMYTRKEVQVCLRDQKIKDNSSNYVGKPFRSCWMYIGEDDYWSDCQLDTAITENYQNTFVW